MMANEGPVPANPVAPEEGGFWNLLSRLFSGLFGGGMPGGSFLDLFKQLFTTSDPSAEPATNQSTGFFSGVENRVRNTFSRAVGLFVPDDPKFNSATALNCARTDDAGGGYCGRGVHNILTQQGYRLPGANGHDWDKTLPQNGWVKLEGVDARHAPEGAVLVFDSDVQRGRRPRNGDNNRGGDEYGHVEIVTRDPKTGERLYTSDAARSNFGGTVPDNFVGAYIPRDRYEAMLAANRQSAEPAQPAVTASAPSRQPGTSLDRVAPLEPTFTAAVANEVRQPPQELNNQLRLNPGLGAGPS